MKLRTLGGWTAELRPLEKHLERARVKTRSESARGGFAHRRSYVVSAPLSIVTGKARTAGTGSIGVIYGDDKISVWQPAGMRTSKTRIKNLLESVLYALKQKRRVKGWKLPDYRPHVFRTKEQSAAEYRAVAESWERYAAGSTGREAAMWRRRIAKAREKARQIESLGMSRDRSRRSSLKRRRRS